MDWIEQAIFTSAETDRGSGYQLVATSPGVCEADARELTMWCPSHDSLLDAAPQAVSVNFHPLPSGLSCVSRTTPSGWEYSGRGRPRIYTQCLLVPPAVFGRFANNPFAILKAATAAGCLRQLEKIPERLDPLRLAGRAAAVDVALLARLAANPGPQWMASLVQAALDSVSVAIVGGPPADQLIAGLLNCLPIECREEYSFSTGLKFSSRRPFRIVALSGEPEEQRRIERMYNVAVLRLDAAPPDEFAPLESWARLVHRVLKAGRATFLASHLSRRHTGFTPRDLPLFGLQLLEALEASALSSAPPQAETPQPEPQQAEAPQSDQPHDDAESCENGEQGYPNKDASSPRPLQRAHAAHTHPAHPPAPAAARPQERPSQQIHASREVLEKLERLDDLVFEALAGNSEALEEFKTLWPQLRSGLDEAMLLESREQYLRYALAIWTGLEHGPGTRDPALAAQSLEVLAILFGE
jgi:hypothetical protein